MAVDKSRSAMGTVGYLIRVADDRQYVFRVYDDEHNFVDYDILHYDMRIQIQDEDATFYTNAVRDYIDHSPETLGHTE
jgi:uncharacterized protein YllA (UPF0747 family)